MGLGTEWYIEIGPVTPPPGSGDGSDAPIYTEIFSGTRTEAEARARLLSERYRESYRVPRRIDEAIKAVHNARGKLCDVANMLGRSQTATEVWKVVESLDQTREEIEKLLSSFRSGTQGTTEYPLYHSDIGCFDLGYSIVEHKVS